MTAPSKRKAPLFSKRKVRRILRMIDKLKRLLSEMEANRLVRRGHPRRPEKKRKQRKPKKAASK